MKLSIIFCNCVCFIFALAACNNNVDEKTKRETVKAEKSVDSAYAGWLEAEGDKIKFRYPDNWLVKKKNYGDKMHMFGLINKTEKDFKDFFLLEIYEFETMGRPFKEFKFESVDLFAKKFDQKDYTVRNTEDITFKGAEARKYEVELRLNGRTDNIDLYAVNGISRYYVFFANRDEQIDPIIHGIMNSVLLYK